MVKVDFQLMPREPKGQQVWVYLNGELVAKCSTTDKDGVLASYGYKATRRGGYQSGAVKQGKGR